MDGSLIFLGIFALLVIVGIVIAIAYLAAGMTLAFTAFVMNLPLIISIVMFIVFPPTLIVFLVGYAMIQFGVADKVLKDKAN